MFFYESGVFGMVKGVRNIGKNGKQKEKDWTSSKQLSITYNYLQLYTERNIIKQQKNRKIERKEIDIISYHIISYHYITCYLRTSN